MKQLLLFLAGNSLLAGTAQAQATFHVGPRVGLSVASAHFADTYQASYSSRSGVEAGLTGSLQVGHFALQPSVLFSQKGYRNSYALRYIDPPIPTEPGTVDEAVRLNYLTLPLNLAFTLGRAGQGLQVFGGPYVGLLLGGNYTTRIHEGSYYPGGSSNDREQVRQMQAGSVVANPSSDNAYSQCFDVGLQAGLGYRFNGVLVQASYGVGLRNLAVQYEINAYIYNPTAYYNRSFQLSLSYLVGPRS